MKVNIQALHFTAADHLKGYIDRKCSKLDVFFDRILSCDVRLGLQPENGANTKQVEIVLHVPGDTLVASDQGKSFEAAVDTTTDKLKIQLKRYKERLRERA